MNEWQRLTPEDSRGIGELAYRYEEGVPYPHYISERPLGSSRPYKRVEELSNAELDALAIHSNAVKALFDTMKEIARDSCCQTPGCCIDDPMCTPMTARAAVARFKAVGAA